MRTFSTHRSKRGSTLLIVAGLSAAIAMGLWSVQALLPQLFQQTLRSTDLLRYRLALHSVVDYTALSIKQRWCVNSQWVPDPDCPLTAISHMNTLEAPFLLERLLLTDDALLSLKDRTPSIEASRLDSVQAEVSLNQVTDQHPLHMTVKDLGKDLTLRIQILRENNVYRPSTDRQVYLRIRATLLVPGDNTFKGTSNLYVEGLFAYLPRELGTMSLVVANDLRLDQSATPAMPASPATVSSEIEGRGDVYIPTVENPNPLGSAEGIEGVAGVTFHSPVFVNGNLVLPSNKDIVERNRVAPVTFVDKIYLGDGKLRNGSTIFNPIQQRSTRLKTWSSLPGIYGIKNALENDGERDIGLDYLSGRIVGANPNVDLNLVRQCLAHAATRADLLATQKSGLISKEIRDGVYRLALSPSYYQDKNEGTVYNNEFSPQNLDPSYEASLGKGTWELAKAPYAGPEPEDSLWRKPILKITAIGQWVDPLSKTNRSNDFVMAVGEKVTLKTPESSLVLELKAVKVSDNLQPNQVELVLQSSGMGLPNFLDLQVEAFDLGYAKGRNIRLDQAPYGSKGKLSLKKLFGGAFVTRDLPPSQWIYTSEEARSALGNPALIPQESTNYGALTQRCESRTGALAFGAADWDHPFHEGTRFSWNFAEPSKDENMHWNPYSGTVELSQASMEADPDSPPGSTLQIRSIVGTCNIKESAEMVVGFMVCDRLEIEARSKPLYMVGTYIVSNASIHPSAIKNGVHFYNVYHPQMTPLLRAQGFLKDSPECSDPNKPDWHPRLSLLDAEAKRGCRPNRLQERADPFRWTKVDPDQGLLPNEVTPRAKNRILRFLVKEISRESNI